MAAYINALELISEVEMRPIIWDTSSDEYKDRAKKAEAWAEVCRALFLDYDLKSEADQMNLEREVLGRWKSIRDCYTKDYKKFANKSSQGHRAKKSRRYIFSKQLAFLRKVMKTKPSGNTLQDTEEGTESILDMSNTPGKVHPVPFERMKRARSPAREEAKQVLDKRKRISLSNEIIQTRERGKNLSLEDRIRQLIEEHNEQKSDEDKDFFMSMLPSVRRLNEHQKLEFRVQVLLALQNVKAGQHSLQSTWPQSSNPSCMLVHHSQTGHSDAVERLSNDSTSAAPHSTPESPCKTKQEFDAHSPVPHPPETKDFITHGL
ncbi:uncharacterized protein [Macrobrachium rosenbergii]|uniref:uncharacterized protein n=1 Tax=Macrobrachium rosenbergii TaxID=79674 RepID=UPI0034D462B1